MSVFMKGRKMLTRRNVLKAFVATVGVVLFCASRLKSSDGVVSEINQADDFYDITFENNKACATKNHAFVAIINGRRCIIPVKQLRVGDVLCCPKYLAERRVRAEIMKSRRTR